jgi:endonuclease YncB( thermonuclease family)
MLIALAAAAVVCTSPHIADGDTLTCAGQRVRLFGINAPELSHPDLGIAEEPSGREASARLQQLTRARVTCTVAGNQYDRYRRMVAKCATVQTPDLGAEMVREGLACQWIRYSRHEYDGLGRDCDRRGK